MEERREGGERGKEKAHWKSEKNYNGIINDHSLYYCSLLSLFVSLKKKFETAH